jgi:AcrR family transcriptional regulator
VPPAQPPAQQSGETPGTGLRERRRAKVREEIYRTAMRLFREQGYDRTTVQEIAEAAVISESTFYRYFPAKADIVMEDELDPLFVSTFRAQPAGHTSVEAFRAAMRSVLGTMTEEGLARQRDRFALIMSVPDLRAAMLDQLVGGIDLLAAEIGLRTGRPVTDTEVRALAGAVVGASIAVMFSTDWQRDADLATLLDAAISALPGSLSL